MNFKLLLVIMLYTCVYCIIDAVCSVVCMCACDHNSGDNNRFAEYHVTIIMGAWESHMSNPCMHQPQILCIFKGLKFTIYLANHY